jgi:hypothetical protein
VAKQTAAALAAALLRRRLPTWLAYSASRRGKRRRRRGVSSAAKAQTVIGVAKKIWTAKICWRASRHQRAGGAMA